MEALMPAPAQAIPAFTPPQQALLLSLSRGTTRTAACHAARTTRRALYHWIVQDPDFAEAVENAEAGAIAVAEELAFTCAMKAAEDPHYLRALFFWLKHRAGWSRQGLNPPPPIPWILCSDVKRRQRSSDRRGLRS
jgi:hypothetical protein